MSFPVMTKLIFQHQSSMWHDISEIILISRLGAQLLSVIIAVQLLIMFLIIISVSLAA